MGLIVDFKSSNALREYQPWLHDISSAKNDASGVSFNPLNEWAAIISSIDSLRLSDDQWNQVLMASNVVMASTTQLRGDLWMLSIGLPENEASAVGKSMMDKWAKSSTNRTFKNISIYHCDKFQYALVNNCLAIASGHALMEDIIIRSEKKEVIFMQPNFAAAYESKSTDAPLHFFFAMDSGQWLQLDPFSSNGKITFSGYALINSSSTSSLGMATKGNGFEVAKSLPSNTAILDAFSYTTFDTGWKKLEEFNASNDAYKFWSQVWKDYGDTCSCDLNDLLLSWRSGEWGSAVVPMNDSTSSKVMYIQTKDSLDVIEKLKPLLRQKEGSIYQVLYPQLMDRNKPQTFLIECNYVTQIGNTVLFASTVEELKALLNKKESLSENPQFQKALRSMNNDVSRFIYQTEYYVSPLPASLTSILSGGDFFGVGIEHFKENRYLIQIALSTSPYALASSEEASQESESTSSTNTTLSELVSEGSRTWRVINHNDKKQETLAQNNKAELCLYDSNGKLHWSKTIEGGIIGDVTQIDALKNGKLQYAFTTDKALYIIDRNGNNLKGFPITPMHPIQSPLHVADYDKDKKYRLLFTAGDDYLFNYSIDGKQTVGWKSTVQSAVFISDFKIGNEDYIFTVSHSGKIQLVKRTGEIKTQTQTNLRDYDGKKCIITAGNNLEQTLITYNTKSGEARTIELGK